MSNTIKFNLDISILREGNKFIAYSPALDLSTCGDSYAQAKKRFSEITKIFFEEIAKKDNANKILPNLGWQQESNKWLPPLIVAQDRQMINLSV